MGKITDIVANLAKPIAERLGCELWDVEYVKEAGGWYLRVYIDRPDGVSTKHCEEFSRALDPALDEREDLFPGSYTFEVSSPGAERRLRKPSDFERFAGHFVEVKLYKPKDGKKSFLGTLDGWRDGDVDLTISGERRTFEKSEVADVRLRIM